MADALLLTLDENYIPQMKVLMTSIYINNPGRKFDVYLIHSRLSEDKLKDLGEDLEKFSYTIYPIRSTDDLFSAAKVTDRYPKGMYYRLLAGKFLPEDLDEILYLDSDMLVVNPLDELLRTDISAYIFAAASHTGKTDMANNVNRIRLGTDTDYYN